LLSRNYKILERFEETKLEVKGQSEKICELERRLEAKKSELDRSNNELEYQKDLLVQQISNFGIFKPIFEDLSSRYSKFTQTKENKDFLIYILRENSKGLYNFFGKRLLERNKELLVLHKKFESLETSNSKHQQKFEKRVESEYTSHINKLRDKVDTVVEKWKGSLTVSENYSTQINHLKTQVHE
jgi:hypothetical protein